MLPYIFSQGCEDLQNLVKLVKVVLNKLLEESDNGGDPPPPPPPQVTPPAADPSPGSEGSGGEHNTRPVRSAAQQKYLAATAKYIALPEKRVWRENSNSNPLSGAPSQTPPPPPRVCGRSDPRPPQLPLRSPTTISC